MSKIICEKEELTAVADAIRAKTASTAAMSLGEMATNIASISGGSVGGLSIKEITFTDRPTMWTWLLSNYTKILTGYLDVPLLIPFPICLGNKNYTFNRDPNEIASFSFCTTAFYPDGNLNARLESFHITIYSTHVNATLIPTTADFVHAPNDGVSKPTFDALYAQSWVEVQDELWAEAGFKFTFYYIG